MAKSFFVSPNTPPLNASIGMQHPESGRWKTLFPQSALPKPADDRNQNLRFGWKNEMKTDLELATREKQFYRDLLEQISRSKRNTIAKRIAESGLIFWDQMRKEAIKNGH